MESTTLDEKFLGHLNKGQKALVWEYYRIMTSPPLSLDDETKVLDMIDDESRKLDRILKRAEKDEKLAFYLELVDYFCTDVSEDDVLNGDKRAYLSEYLSAKIEGKQGDKKEVSADDSRSLLHVFVECVNGSFSFFELKVDKSKLSEVKRLRDIPELSAMIHKRCQTALSEPDKVLILSIPLNSSAGKTGGVIRYDYRRA